MARGLSQREVGLVVGGIGLGVSTGFALGYRMGQLKVWAVVDETVEQELEALRKKYREIQDEMVEQKKPDPEDLASRYGNPAPEPPRIEIVPVEAENVFDRDGPEDPGPVLWNYAAEMANRKSGEPYVIHIDEFSTPPAEFDRMSVTWFEGDDVMIDGRDIPIDDPDTVVGLENLEKFGHGSENPHTVYVRNEELNLDIEVTKSFGTFAEHVGVSPPGEDDGELRHSADRRAFDDER